MPTERMAWLGEKQTWSYAVGASRSKHQVGLTRAAKLLGVLSVVGAFPARDPLNKFVAWQGRVNPRTFSTF